MNKGCHTCMIKHTMHVQSLRCSTYLTWGQFHKTIYDVFSSQKDRTMFLNQNLRFIKIKKLTKFSLSGVNLRS